MSLRRSAAIARNELRVLRRDPMPLIVLFVMPVIMAALYRTTFRSALVLSGHPNSSGSDFAVPAVIGVALTTLVRTSQQLNAIGFPGATVLGAIGGALVPLSTLPAWTHHVAPGTPQYWAMRANRDLLLDHESWRVTLLPIVILTAFTVVAAAIAVRRLRVDDRDVGWF